MEIRDLSNLSNTLLRDEFDLAKAIYTMARDAGNTPQEAAAIVYRHGYSQYVGFLKSIGSDLARYYLGRNKHHGNGIEIGI